MGNAGPPASPYLVVGVASVAAGLALAFAAPVARELGRLTGTAGSVGFSATHSLLGAVGSAEAACRSAGLLHPANANSAAVAGSGVGAALKGKKAARCARIDDGKEQRQF